MQRILSHEHREFARRAHSRIRAHFCISNGSTNTNDFARRALCWIRARFCISNGSTNTGDLARRAHSWIRAHFCISNGLTNTDDLTWRAHSRFLIWSFSFPWRHRLPPLGLCVRVNGCLRKWYASGFNGRDISQPHPTSPAQLHPTQPAHPSSHATTHPTEIAITERYCSSLSFPLRFTGTISRWRKTDKAIINSTKTNNTHEITTLVFEPRLTLFISNRQVNTASMLG